MDICELPLSLNCLVNSLGYLSGFIKYLSLILDPFKAVCQNHAGCEYFSQWFEEGPEHQGWCYLFSSCAVWDASECNELVDQCFSGPAYPDMDDCSGP